MREGDLAKIASATISIVGTIASTVVSGLTGFGVALFFMGGAFIFDQISDAKKNGKA